jgi:hypothetical protein
MAVLGLALFVLAAAAQVAAAGHDYGTALSKSILYFEAQRSGRLPGGQRIAWRANSGLLDGKANGVRGENSDSIDPDPDLLLLGSCCHLCMNVPHLFNRIKSSGGMIRSQHLRLPCFLLDPCRWIWWAATTTPATTSSSACRWRSR